MDATHGARRYSELLDQLAEEHGRAYGWMAAVARKLGIHRSTLARILKGQRHASVEIIVRACEVLPLRPGFFEAETGHYMDWFGDGFDLAIDISQGISGQVTALGIAKRAHSQVAAMPSQLARPLADRAQEARELAGDVLKWRVIELAQETERALTDEKAAEAGLLLSARIAAEFLPVWMEAHELVTVDPKPSTTDSNG